MTKQCVFFLSCAGVCLVQCSAHFCPHISRHFCLLPVLFSDKIKHKRNFEIYVHFALQPAPQNISSRDKVSSVIAAFSKSGVKLGKGLDTPKHSLGFQELEASKLSSQSAHADNKISTPRTGRLYPSGDIPGWVDPWIKSKKNPVATIGNRTHDPLSFNALSQPTGPPCTPGEPHKFSDRSDISP